MHPRIKMSYLEPILGHPVRRQIFGDTSGQTFYMTRDCVISTIFVALFDEQGTITVKPKAGNILVTNGV